MAKQWLWAIRYGNGRSDHFLCITMSASRIYWPGRG